MIGKLFRLIWRRSKLPPNLSEVEDFLERHGTAIAKAIETKHTCPFPPGKRIWRFSWRWPFVHTWHSKAICLCQINQAMKQCQCLSRHCLCGVLAVLDQLDKPLPRRIIHADYSNMGRDAQIQTIRAWKRRVGGLTFEQKLGLGRVFVIAFLGIFMFTVLVNL